MSSIHKFLRFTVAIALLLAVGGPLCGVEAAAYDTRENDGSVQIIASSSSAGTIRSITPDYSAKIQAKKQQNADVVGWLRVPGTDINEVILQNPSKSNPFTPKNAYYLNLNFDKQPDKNGVFSADHRASFGANGRDSLSRITTIYAHSWSDNPDGEIFAQLKRYRDSDFAKEHPYIFFSTEPENMVWEVFAVFDTTIYLPYVRPRLSTGVFYQTLDMVRDLSYYNYDIGVSADDRILALSTCTYSVDGHPSLPSLNDYRFVVMARLVGPEETLRDSAVFAVNASRLSPDATYSMSHL